MQPLRGPCTLKPCSAAARDDACFLLQQCGYQCSLYHSNRIDERGKGRDETSALHHRSFLTARCGTALSSLATDQL
jgi:hypothetical protein